MNSKLAASLIKENQLSNLRIIAFALILLGLYLNGLGLLLLLPFPAIFILHRKQKRFQNELQLRLDLKNALKARRELEWAQIPTHRMEHSPAHFKDLNLTGEHSLLSLIDLTVSDSGTEGLIERFRAPWLTSDELLQNRRSVEEWLARPKQRRHWILHRFRENSPIRFRLMRQYLTRPFHTPRGKQIAILLLGLQALTLFLLFAFKRYYEIPGFLYLMGLALASRQFSPQFGELLEIETSLRQLRRLSPGWSLKALEWGVSVLSIRANPFVYVFVHVTLPLDYLTCLYLEKKRSTFQEKLEAWEKEIGAIDAAVSIANYSRQIKGVTPEFLGDSPHPVMEAEGAAHPLLSRKQAVTNPIHLNAENRHLIINGSNMSGKSTYLRTVALHFLLARAGANVPAKKFRFSNALLFTQIQIEDDLSLNSSLFFSEISALKKLVDLCQEEKPVLYFLDEMLRGTNHEERLKGSHAVLKAVATPHAAGIITTHDLKLIEQCDWMRPFHFSDIIVNGKPSFDYLLKPGTTRTTNALILMKEVGLPISS